MVVAGDACTLTLAIVMLTHNTLAAQGFVSFHSGDALPSVF